MIHDRYHPLRRNPWNEIECGDHYARSMASYGVFLTACGYEYHGPKSHLTFAPRLTPDHFKCAFTAAEGWGTFAQDAAAGTHKAEVLLKWGRLHLRTLSLATVAGVRPGTVTAMAAGKAVPATLEVSAGKANIRFSAEVTLRAGETLTVAMG
jgi:hypothetical protein